MMQAAVPHVDTRKTVAPIPLSSAVSWCTALLLAEHRVPAVGDRSFGVAAIGNEMGGYRWRAVPPQMKNAGSLVEETGTFA